MNHFGISGGFGHLQYVDEYGEPVTRTPITNPYNYDGFVLWQAEGAANNTVYSDRLYQWDSEKHDKLCQKHFDNKGQYWNRREPGKIEAFLSDYLGCPIVLIRIMQYCNQATGYPCWRFDYYEKELESEFIR